MKNLIFAAIFSLLSFTAFAGKLSESVHAFYKAVDGGDFDKAGTLLADDVKAYLPFSPQAMDKMAYEQLGMSMGAAFPDMQHKVLEVTEGKGTAAFKAWFTGTNTGSMMGNPPTGNRVETPFLGYFKYNSKGLITEVNIQFDAANFNAQLMKGIDPKMMAEKAIRDLYVLMDAGQTDKFPMYCAADFKISNPFLAEPSPVQAFQGVIRGQKTAFPDMKHEVAEIVSDGKYVTTRGIFSGTNTGSMMGNPPTGNKVSLPFLVLDELDEKGKIRNRTVQFDSKSFFSQVMGENMEEQNRQTALSILEKLDKRNLDGVCASFAKDAKFTGWAPQTVDVQGYRAVMSELLAAFPDSHFSTDLVVVEGNKVVVRHHFTGTYTGAKFQGTPPSNKKAVVPATVTYRFEDGKPVELWLNADFLGLLIQIGAIPMPK
ncbi:MAG: ester cyclase [Saprospiraceae bacterium]|nr:ester cyclase [Saprospiraceae bacterium]